MLSEDSDCFLPSPLTSRHGFAGDGEGEGLSYGERLGWERREGREERSQFLYSDRAANDHQQQQQQRCRKLTGDCRGRETTTITTSSSDGGEVKANVLIRRSSSSVTRDRRADSHTFY